MMTEYDFAIIGGGIAGASVAAALVPHASVVLLEAEDTPGYHSTKLCARSGKIGHQRIELPDIFGLGDIK